jgi:hypothetical protein
MSIAKKKSSGWLPAEKRRTPEEWDERRTAESMAAARRDCDWLRLWRSCPGRQCLRVRGCTGDPGPCLQRRPTKLPGKRNDIARAEAPMRLAFAAGNQAPRFAISAAEAAAAIAASIAGPPEPGSLPGEELEPIVRDGRVQYVPRRRP